MVELVNPWADEPAGRIAGSDAAEPDVDWLEVLAHARRHRIAPFVAQRLRRKGLLEQLPAEAAQAFDHEARLATYHEMAMLAQLRAIQRAFDEAGVEFLVVKGLTLSSACYGSLGLRVNRDIDLLVSPIQLARAHAVLAGLGFARIEPAGELSAQELANWTERHKDWVYGSALGVVELHHRLFDNVILNDPGVLSRARRVRLFGHTEVRALGSADEVAYLALHGALHSWSRLKWLLDLAFLFREMGPAALQALLHDHRGGPAERALHQAVLLCSQLFGVEPAATSKRGWIDNLLVAAAWRAMAGGGATELEDSRFGTTLKNASHYLLWTNPRFWLAELAYDLTDTSRDRPGRNMTLPIWLVRPASWISRHGMRKRR